MACTLLLGQRALSLICSSAHRALRLQERAGSSRSHAGAYRKWSPATHFPKLSRPSGQMCARSTHSGSTLRPGSIIAARPRRPPQAIALLNTARQHGFDPSDYAAPELLEMSQAVENDRQGIAGASRSSRRIRRAHDRGTARVRPRRRRRHASMVMRTGKRAARRRMLLRLSRRLRTIRTLCRSRAPAARGIRRAAESARRSERPEGKRRLGQGAVGKGRHRAAPAPADERTPEGQGSGTGSRESARISQAAVKSFQELHSIAATGVVDDEDAGGAERAARLAHPAGGDQPAALALHAGRSRRAPLLRQHSVLPFDRARIRQAGYGHSRRRRETRQ